MSRAALYIRCNSNSRQGWSAERVVDLRSVHLTGAIFGFGLGLIRRARHCCFATVKRTCAAEPNHPQEFYGPLSHSTWGTCLRDHRRQRIRLSSVRPEFSFAQGSTHNTVAGVTLWMGLDPTNTPRMLRDAGSDGICDLTLGRK